ncbi:MAG TPA: hypothetical protein PLC59_04040 [Bacteroidales bacterium]|jgi:hypothetical protein|nr:hypothetical protein [Bacteroidales bacterium]
MSYNLFLDDARLPEDVKWTGAPPMKWEIARTYKQFVKIIESRGVPDTVSFDHDLAPEHYEEHKCAHDIKMISYGKIRYHNFKEKSGYEAAKFLAEYCISKKIDIPKYYIHTLNLIGRKNISLVLENAQQEISKQ